MPMPPSTTATDIGHSPVCATLTPAPSAAVASSSRSAESWVPTGSATTSRLVGSNFSAVLVPRYLCATCGFSEEWVDDRAGLEKLSAKDNR